MTHQHESNRAIHRHCKQIIKQKTLLAAKGMTEMIVGKKEDNCHSLM
jgi:hypothetical protein